MIFNEYEFPYSELFTSSISSDTQPLKVNLGSSIHLCPNLTNYTRSPPPPPLPNTTSLPPTQTPTLTQSQSHFIATPTSQPISTSTLPLSTFHPIPTSPLMHSLNESSNAVNNISTPLSVMPFTVPVNHDSVNTTAANSAAKPISVAAGVPEPTRNERELLAPEQVWD
ncbi:hypothetical protein PIB30_037074 [Stylosanthes scabra]|uniref:Uncharacterized protein n=1 Tax=Stylosanthes scabra TaxID=79078 RepID=A0ABU6WH35_9FABA|nr:hypothetical protein [Stylosanthes scabra]